MHALTAHQNFFSPESLLYVQLWDFFLNNEIQAFLSPKVHSTMWTMHESEL